MEKPTQVKPGLYTIFYEHLKQIAKEYGYNLVVHGSMHRDLDLIAIPWVDMPRPEQDMILDFQEYLTGIKTKNTKGEVPYSTLPGGRHAYTISLNRGNKHGEWVRFEDKEYYLDISVTPFLSHHGNALDVNKNCIKNIAKSSCTHAIYNGCEKCANNIK